MRGFGKCDVCELDDYVGYYKKHNKVLCGQCVDFLNGHTWVDEHGKHLINEKYHKQFQLTCKKVFGE